MNPAPEKKIDKSAWGPGPWQEEPDRVEWRAHGFPVLMVRQPEAGHWCGYVGVPPGHPWFGKRGDDWEDPTFRGVDVHGGITYSDACRGEVCHIPAPGEPDDVWWHGFDCAHYNDISPGRAAREQGLGLAPWPAPPMASYKDVAYVRRQAERLAEQAREVAA